MKSLLIAHRNSCPALGAVLFATLFMLTSASPARAQDASADQLAQANNPLANMKALNFHNYYVPKLAGLPDETANTFWLRYAQPVGRVLVRASLPLPTVPMGAQTDPESGLGDFNIFGAYLAKQDPKFTFGIGPLLAAPTASADALGTGKWQAGAAAIVFAVPSPLLQVGGLLTWQASFAGDDDRESTSLLAAQPFAIWQLGGGAYLRSTGIMVFNLQSGDYNVPFGLGVGMVSKVDTVVFNFFAEPQFTFLHEGIGQPGLQLFFGLNTQFTGS
jgi:hypothetical protein